MIQSKANRILINGKESHISELSKQQLQFLWKKQRAVISGMHEQNKIYSSGWRGLVLKLIGVKLPMAIGGFPFSQANKKKIITNNVIINFQDYKTRN